MSKKGGSLNPRQELLKVEKKIFLQNQQTIDDTADVSDSGFKAYLNRYKKAVKNFIKPVEFNQILDAISKAKLAIFGDYHTLDQSQRSFIRFIRSFMKHHHKRVVIAIETIQSKHQKHLTQFMQGEINAEQFIKKIGFKEHWFFDLWSSYEVIFDFIKYHNLPTYAIDDRSNHKSLKERDVYMAEKLAGLAKKYPDHMIFVLVGDLHLAPGHLPKEITKQAKKHKIKMPVVTMYQNSPEIYWQLSEQELVDYTLTVKVSDGQYCRMNTPPIIVQQSYINWLYHEEGGFDWFDAKTSFLQIMCRVADCLELPLPKNHDDIEVYTCGDLRFLGVLKKKKIFTAKELKFIRDQVMSSQSYLMPIAKMAYIANVSIHHAAEEASHYLKFMLSGLEMPRSHKDAFYANALHEAIGYLGSKFINHKRKCPRYKDYVDELRYLDRAGLTGKNHVEYETSQLFINHHQLVKKGQLFHTNKITNLSNNLFLSITHAIGYDLGDHLYYAYMLGKVSKELLQHIFTDNFEEEGEPQRLFLQLHDAVKGLKRPRKL
jgi:uncharacterized iron-regulated protein